jgi:ABC-type multidrug transport system fused ATPase/permease subunit
MISKPSVLLLDEATSALDNKSEAKFQAALDASKADRTTIMVAHRLSTVKNCDEIVVMDGGNVVERGTHDQLRALQGRYFAMLNEIEVESTGSEEARSSEVEDANTASETASEVLAVAKEKVAKEDNGDENKEADDKLTKEMNDYVWKHTKGDMFWILLALMGSITAGVGYASSTVILGKILGVAAGATTVQPFTCQYNESNLINETFNEMTCSMMDCTTDACWGCVPIMNDTLGSVSGSSSDGLVDLLMNGFVTVSSCDEEVACGGATGLDCAYKRFPGADKDKMNGLVGAFGILAAIMFVGRFMQYLGIEIAGTRLTARMRTEFYHLLLDKSAGWQDRFHTSDLTETLAVDAAAAREIYSDSIPMYGYVFGVLVAGIAIAFYYCARMALVVLGLLPFLIIASTAENSVMLNNDEEEHANAGQLAAREAGTIFENFRVITSLGHAKGSLVKYASLLKGPEEILVKKAVSQGLAGAGLQIVMFGIFSVAFWFGGQAIYNEWCDYDEMNIAMMAIIFCGFQAGQDAALLPDKNKALVKFKHAFKMFFSPVLVDEDDADGDDKMPPGSTFKTAGKIEFKDVRFSYPTRPEAEVLCGLNITIEAGQTVAFVGASGCGKSTLIQMVQKMYHANSGQILIDGVDVRSISTTLLREKIAVVPQEPKLFNMSVADNVSYRPVAAESAPALVEQMVKDAATTANADAFVQKLEGGYEYEVGKFGGKLSGGQCQRVAIARSLYGPADSIKILLLDEATSALDNESENLVQEALSKASVGRTTIIVALRLSTIQHVDQIFVIDHGKMVECGTFAELKSKQDGAFAQIYASQF